MIKVRKNIYDNRFISSNNTKTTVEVRTLPEVFCFRNVRRCVRDHLLKVCLTQEQTETAYVRQAEYSLDSECGSGLLTKFNEDFLAQGYICNKIP